MNLMQDATTSSDKCRPTSVGTADAVQRPESIAFDTENLLDILEAASPEQLDRIGFGVVALAADATVERYNRFESQLSGLPPDRVIGRHFFTAIAPCTNNFMVAHRFETETELDAVVDYMFTFRLAPMNVRLRLLKRPGARFMYFVVEKRA
jgi:photoactive yellow protein